MARKVFPIFGSLSFFGSQSVVFIAVLLSLSTVTIRSLQALAPVVRSIRFRSTRITRMPYSTTATCSLSATPNPLLESWSSQPFSLPPFDKIETHHYQPALEVGMQEQLQELQHIVDNTEPPTFDNVFVAYDRVGATLSKVGGVFSNMCSSMNTPELQQVQTTMTPILSRHRSSTYTMPGLFEKIEQVRKVIDQSPDNENLTTEDRRLVERIYLDFTRAGAHFDTEKQQKYADLQAQLASLSTQFMQNVLKDEETYELVLKRDDLSGCPDSLIEAAKNAAEERNKSNDEYVITLSRSLVEPFLTFSDRRDLRQTAWEAWTSRGEMSPDRDNLKIAVEMLQLRQQVAKLHGFDNFAQYQCVDRMAKTPENVIQLLENVWEKAKVSANREREALEQYVNENYGKLEGGIQPWDWRYYAEKVRIAKYNFDESLLKPYLSLDSVTGAVMAVSNKLFGLKYVERDDVVSYNEDVKTYEVRDERNDDKLVAVFIHDNYARPFKSGGAWMSEYRSQSKNFLDENDPYQGIPIVSNNNNFAKGRNTLLSFDDATTLFHEMGHGHHGMLSDCTYSRLSSTNVLTDFVELPSQLMEHWFEEPEVLKEYCRHFESGEPVPDELLEKLKAAKMFNQGFETIEYTACALLDMLLHQVDDYEDFDISKFEKEQLDRLGMPQGIVMRHRPAHFLHLFASTMYAAGYYVYLWAEVLDADAYAAFQETSTFDPETAKRIQQYVYSAGNKEAPDELFRKFRGRDPDIKYMLAKKGLIPEEALV
ncbi:peptidyl-dipeptidase dcp [Nitzschia inconspicua]|uniref:Peptidyl-dipeptidase dcp n=1 Tax=Nitzschia inconspicua TaxID=303405 RepID=A0A9K3KQC4_9STRA|nr:peptidyl-dipeptidase dcp [Nitzschia inconspicua]